MNMAIDYQPPKGIQISDAIASTAGATDAGKVIKTDAGGLIDATFIDDGDIDHGSVGGLSDDDHTQYTLLAGRSGGQTVSGDTAASGSLSLQSTAHATKGTISLDSVVQKKCTQITTTDATPTIANSLAVVENSTVCFEAKVLAKEANGIRACFWLKGCFYRNASGNVTQVGATETFEVETDAALDATLAATTGTQTIDVNVTGKAATTVLWDVVINYFVN